MERGRLARLAPALLLATLLVMTAAATYAAARRVHDANREHLADDAHAAVTAIDRRLEDYGQVLRGAAGLYAASDDVTYQEFHDFFADQGVIRRFPGVQVIGFASYIPRAGFTAYARKVDREAAASGLDYPRFRIHPAPKRDTQEALVIDHIEPPPGNSEAFGLDFLSEPNRRRAALLARRTGRPAASAPIGLVQARGTSLGFDLMVPVYGGPPSQTGAPRPWKGVVYAAFRTDNLLRGVLGDLGATTDLEVYDLGPSATVPPDTSIGSGRTIAFDLRPGRASRARDDDDARVETLDVAGRRWAVAYARSGTTLSTGERAVPWVIAVAGILVSLLAAALLRTLSMSRIRAERLADRRTVELREREEQLRRSNEELEHFAYLASHDLQEPLRTMTSYVGLLESRVGDQLDDRARSWLGFVSDGAGRMSHLIADLLEYSRTGRTGEQADVALNDAWDLAVANLQHAIGDAGASVTRGELPVVTARPRDMTSMLQNLIANGLKYRRDGVAPEVHAEASPSDGRWDLRVSDNGIGIEPRFHDRVFGLFQRLHTSEEYPGTGMGLAIVKKIVESSGGTVRVESEPGAGATFVVTLPAGDAA